MMNARFTDTNGNEVPVPPCKTFAAIRRESMRRASACPIRRTPRDHAAYRAWQYVMALNGIETPHEAEGSQEHFNAR